MKVMRIEKLSRRREREDSPFTDPLFSLQSPSSACDQKYNEKKNEATSVNRLERGSLSPLFATLPSFPSYLAPPDRLILGLFWSGMCKQTNNKLCGCVYLRNSSLNDIPIPTI